MSKELPHQFGRLTGGAGRSLNKCRRPLVSYERYSAMRKVGCRIGKYAKMLDSICYSGCSGMVVPGFLLDK